jgi:hypothetical protein
MGSQLIITYKVDILVPELSAQCTPKKTQDLNGHPLLNDLYSSPNIIRVIKSRRMRWAGHVARMGEKRGAYRILVARPEGRRPLGIPRHKWEHNIKMDLQEVGWGMDWIELAQDRER